MLIIFVCMYIYKGKNNWVKIKRYGNAVLDPRHMKILAMRAYAIINTQ